MNARLPTPPPENDGTEADRQRRAGQAINAVRSGDTEAFTRFIDLYKAQVMSLCVALVRNVTEAEELAQDVFVRAFRYLDALDVRRPVYPWLAKIAYRLAQTHRQQRRRESVLQEHACEQGAIRDRTDDPASALVADEQARRLWRAVGALPERERAAVLLYYRQSLDIKGVADVLGVSAGTVKTALFRARKRLQSALRQGSSDGP